MQLKLQQRQAAVLAVPASAMQYIRQTGLVAAVFRDRVIVPQEQLSSSSSSSSSSKCVDRAQLQAGVSMAASPRLHWPGCRTGAAQLVWAGSPCSRSAADAFGTRTTEVDAAAAAVPAAGGVVYTAVKAVDAITGEQLMSSDGTPCEEAQEEEKEEHPRRWCWGGGPDGVRFIEGATASAVPVTGGVAVDKQQQVTVAVCDSGVDSTHPDLAYAGGQSWVRAPSKSRPVDMVDAGVDFYGHGVVGVAPSVPIYSLKVLDGNGQGGCILLLLLLLVAVLLLLLLLLVVINLSIATYVSSQADDYKDTLQVVCQIFKEASDAAFWCGRVTLGLLPALLAVLRDGALLDWISEAILDSTVDDKRIKPDANRGYTLAGGRRQHSSSSSMQTFTSNWELSGTSQAAPHVAGIAATCILCGACPATSTGLQKLAVVQAAARERLAQQQPYGFAGDPAGPESLGSQRYYGFLAWSKFWRR
ncbi:hypothetical protein COO60DRAFT_1633208 [Scenedesmus sp. NREL 46B-D3]|nr:hypothetical protein COO60DRAFT_1633208 [Scenedesmus sp. NREL 46B-D3]